MHHPDSNLFHQIVLHLPILTTVCAVFFCAQLFARYRAKGGGLHLLWWGIGMATYALGTSTEALTTLFGWHPFVFRLWYIAGAFLGGYPLAQGTIYLLMSRRFANRSAIAVTSFLAVASTFVFLTPLDAALAEPHRLSGAVIEWTWIRGLSPFVNLYSVVFLVGGAIVSALRFRKAAPQRHRYVGNILIAVGALLPGIGGAMTRAGYVEVLYVTELVGLLLVYAGYRLNIVGSPSRAAAPTLAPRAAAVALLGGTLALLAAAPLAAQEEAATTEEEPAATQTSPESRKLPSFFEKTTVTATGHEADVLETATPVTVLDREEIERQTPDNASDLLRAEPGVDVNGVGPNQSRPIIRGQRGLRVLFLADGLRMNNPRRQSDFGEVPGLIDIDAVETVEIVRGPASVLYGSDAIGGVLNLITKAPAGEGLHGGVDLRYGSAAESVGVHGALSGRSDRASFQLDASVREADDYEAPSGRFGDIRLADSTTVLDSGLDDDSVTGTLLWDTTESQEVSFKLTRYRADQAGFGLVEPEAIGDTSGARIRILYPFQDFDRYALGWQGTDLGGGVGAIADAVEARLYYQDNERELANDIDITVPPPAPGAPGILIEADTLNFTDLESWGARFDGRKGLGNHRHLISYGLEGYRDDSFNTDASETVVSLTFPFPPFVIPIDVRTDDVANAPNAENTSWGAFAQAEIAATDRLLVTAGARHQTVETRAEPTPGWDIAGLDFEDDRTVGSISAIFEATPELRLYGSYGTAFRAPNLIERLFNGITPEGIGFQILNPALDSETSENLDLGVKYRRDNAVFELTLFRNEIDDGIVQHFLSPGEVAALPPAVQQQIADSGAIFVVQQRNVDRLRYEGVEVAVGYRAPHDLAFGGNFTYLDAERIDSSNPPTGDTYSDKLNVFARWEPLDRPFWAEARVRHNGDDELSLQPGEPPPVVGTTLPSFTVVALAGGWTFLERDAQRHELFARIENATDELYSESSNATFFRPQPERDVRVGYRLRM